tara:strand:+ start:293 stop:847 length:555 start_codon:yes stop_codon:yes gene_type:complete
MKNNQSILLHGDNLNKIIKRMSHEIIENQTNLSDLIIIGIRTRGEFIARRIKKHIKDISGEIIDFGIIDVTFHRDDFRTNLGSPKVGPSEIEANLDNRPVVLIDDVLYTGRTIRSAMDEIFSFGRPSAIKLGVIVDRGHRELPIRPDFIGKNFPTSADQHIHVYLSEVDDVDEIVLVDYKDLDE